MQSPPPGQGLGFWQVKITRLPAAIKSTTRLPKSPWTGHAETWKPQSASRSWMSQPYLRTGTVRLNRAGSGSETLSQPIVRLFGSTRTCSPLQDGLLGNAPGKRPDFAHLGVAEVLDQCLEHKPDSRGMALIIAIAAIHLLLPGG